MLSNILPVCIAIYRLPFLKSDCLICHRPIIIIVHIYKQLHFWGLHFFATLDWKFCNKNPCDAFKVGGKFPELDLSQLSSSQCSQYTYGEIIPVINLLNPKQAGGESVENCIFLLKLLSNRSLGLLFVISITKLPPVPNFKQIGLKTKKLGFSTFLAKQSLKYKMTS